MRTRSPSSADSRRKRSKVVRAVDALMLPRWMSSNTSRNVVPAAGADPTFVTTDVGRGGRAGPDPSSVRPSQGLEGHHLADLAVFLDREVVTRQARDRVAFRVHDHGIDRDQVYPGGEAGVGRGGWRRLRLVGGGADRP